MRGLEIRLYIRVLFWGHTVYKYIYSRVLLYSTRSAHSHLKYDKSLIRVFSIVLLLMCYINSNGLCQHNLYR